MDRCHWCESKLNPEIHGQELIDQDPTPIAACASCCRRAGFGQYDKGVWVWGLRRKFEVRLGPGKQRGVPRTNAQRPCPNTTCGKPNDADSRVCWWCEGRLT